MNRRTPFLLATKVNNSIRMKKVNLVTKEVDLLERHVSLRIRKSFGPPQTIEYFCSQQSLLNIIQFVLCDIERKFCQKRNKAQFGENQMVTPYIIVYCIFMRREGGGQDE